MYPVIQNAEAINASDILSLPVHEFFKLTPPVDWTPSKFAAHDDAINMGQFVQGLSAIRRAGIGTVNTYAGACLKYYKTEEGKASLDSAELDMSLRRAHEEMGKSESIYLAHVRTKHFLKGSKAVQSDSPSSSSVRALARLQQRQQHGQQQPLQQEQSLSPAQPCKKSDEKRKAIAVSASQKRTRKEIPQYTREPSPKIEEPWHSLIHSAVLSHSGCPVELPPLSDVPKPGVDSPLKTTLYYLALDSLHTATEGVDRSIRPWKESLVALSGIWNLFSSKANNLFGAGRTNEARGRCLLSDLEVKDAKLDIIIQPLLDMVNARKGAEDVLDATYALQAQHPELRSFLEVLQTIFKNIIKPLHGNESSSEADAMFVWASVFRDGLPLTTALDLCLGEQGCAAATLSKSQLATIFSTGNSTRKCDCILKVGGLEVGNFEAKRAKASMEDVAVQRLKNIKINKSILLELGRYGLECPPLLNIHGLSASIFQIRKYHDIWVAGSACSPIVLPTTRDEAKFFLEGSVYTLFNLLKHYDQYAANAFSTKQQVDYRQKAQNQESNIYSEEVVVPAALEWEKVVFHTPSRSFHARISSLIGKHQEVNVESEED
ncbi:hypothetical protein BC939DRAFT_433673 [Gamsiella multidivaricata]|uniref:uncharacterized protein n=1 Tax=Gamsiella multidivaricata TaxID=101098 RepID=UPI00221FAE4E|nr:uncharacterized protein BC939DRAFT_433673 [Gamsiella multidivaricata]KAI7832533.1 hypothetical protein BC939DRAFT_433673 [Gamsiella multidivaricata]